jgi:hypothetical protein
MSINLAGLAPAKPTKETKEKPFLPDPNGTLLPLVAASIENKKTIDAHDGVLTTAKAELAKAAFAHACVLYHGRDTNIEDTFQIGTATGKAIVSIQNRYKLPENLIAVRAILGAKAPNVLRDSFTITVDSDAMPAFIQQAFVDGLVELARSLDAMLGTPEGQPGAVFQSITVKPVTSVDKAFHEKRYSLLTPDENARLHQVMPCTIATKFDY